MDASFFFLFLLVQGLQTNLHLDTELLYLTALSVATSVSSTRAITSSLS